MGLFSTKFPLPLPAYAREYNWHTRLEHLNLHAPEARHDCNDPILRVM